MRWPQKGDVVPILLDEIERVGMRKIGFIEVIEVEAARDYLESDQEFVVYGRILRRSYFEGRDRFVLTNDDLWTSDWNYAVWGSDVLPPIALEYDPEHCWDVEPQFDPDQVWTVGG